MKRLLVVSEERIFWLLVVSEERICLVAGFQRYFSGSLAWRRRQAGFGGVSWRECES